MHIYLKSLIAAAGVAAIAAGAHAATATGKADNDAASIGTAKISLVDAVKAAEADAKGKASRAEFEQSDRGWVFDVEVVSGAKVFDVKVDPSAGRVISSTEDKAENDDEHDEKD